LVREIPEMNVAQRLRDADCWAVAAALPAGSALVEFVRVPTFNFHHGTGERWGAPRYLAFVLPAGEPVRVTLIDLGEAVLIDRLVRAFRAAVTGEGSGPEDGLPCARPSSTRSRWCWVGVAGWCWRRMAT
jgi:hypothetical protein